MPAIMTGTKSTVLAFITINCRAAGAPAGQNADVTAVIWSRQRTPVVVVVIVLALVVAVVVFDTLGIAQRLRIGHMEFTNAAANVLRAVNVTPFNGADARENAVDIVDGHGYWPALQCC